MVVLVRDQTEPLAETVALVALAVVALADKHLAFTMAAQEQEVKVITVVTLRLT